MTTPLLIGDADGLPTLTTIIGLLFDNPGGAHYSDGLIDDGSNFGRPGWWDVDCYQIFSSLGVFRAVLTLRENVRQPQRPYAPGPMLRTFALTLTEVPRGAADEDPRIPNMALLPSGQVGDSLGLPSLETVVDEVFGGTRLVDAMRIQDDDNDDDPTVVGGVRLTAEDYDKQGARFAGRLDIVRAASGQEEEYEPETEVLRRFVVTLVEAPRPAAPVTLSASPAPR